MREPLSWAYLVALAVMIAGTVLVLLDTLSHTHTYEHMLWPTLLAYMLSFLFVAIYWVNHHNMIHQAKRVNYPILWCNIAWLFAMSFIPFTTAWIGTHPTSFAPVCLYFADMLLACLTFHLMAYLIARENGTAKQFRLSLRNVVSIVTYTLAAAIGGFCPIAAYIVVALVSCWWIFPEKKKEKEPSHDR